MRVRRAQPRYAGALSDRMNRTVALAARFVAEGSREGCLSLKDDRIGRRFRLTEETLSTAVVRSSGIESQERTERLSSLISFLGLCVLFVHRESPAKSDSVAVAAAAVTAVAAAASAITINA